MLERIWYQRQFTALDLDHNLIIYLSKTYQKNQTFIKNTLKYIYLNKTFYKIKIFIKKVHCEIENRNK